MNDDLMMMCDDHFCGKMLLRASFIAPTKTKTKGRETMDSNQNRRQEYEIASLVGAVGVDPNHK